MNTTPHRVAELMEKDGATPIRAWRLYLGLSVAQAATACNQTIGEYEQLEVSVETTSAQRAKVATAFGIHAEQLEP